MADRISTTRRNSSDDDDDDDDDTHDYPPLVVTAQALESYSEDVAYLWLCATTPKIPVLETPPSSLIFLRDFVAMSRPCIIRNTIPVSPNNTSIGQEAEQAEQSHPQQPLTLSLDELVDLADPNLLLTVDVTPDGHGDCLRMVKQQQQAASGVGDDGEESGDGIQAMFVKPQEQQLTLSEFRSHLRASQRHGWQESVRSSSNNGGGGGADSLAAIRYRVFPLAPDAINDSSRANETEMADDDDNNKEDTSFSASSVYYYSRQNDCLRTELGSLWEQQQHIFPRGFPWAAQAFGSSDNDDDLDDDEATLTSSTMLQPDAVNLWIGNERAMSAMHKDHYENLFYVLDGEKVFTLCPPADAPFLYEGEYPSGRFEQQQYHRRVDDVDDWHVRIDPAVDGAMPSTVHWIAANVMDDRVHDAHHDGIGMTTTRRFPLLRHAHPIQVRVQAGEMLYLPSLWFHQVTQTCETVAINYWYDMKFNSPLWCYFHLLSQLKPTAAAAAPSSAAATTTFTGTTTATITTMATMTTNDQKENKCQLNHDSRQEIHGVVRSS